MSVEMNASELRNWKVLSHLTAEELDDVIYVHVYGYERTKEQGLSALIIKSNHQVFITGFCSLVDGRRILLPKIDPLDKEKMSTKRFDGINVELVEFSGLGITKIVVGNDIGAAFTKDGDLYLWGDMSHSSCKISVECLKCSCKTGPGNGYDTEVVKVGGARLSECNSCMRYCPFTKPSRAAVKKFIPWDSSRELCCQHCRLRASSYDACPRLTYCKPCDLFLEDDDVAKDSYFPHKIINPDKITNTFCGLEFFIWQTALNDLIISGKISNSYYQWSIDNPSNAFITSVSCGGHHLAVISNKGELYTCGDGTQGQLGYAWDTNMGHITLRKVQLEEAVVKVCCGYSATVCLMSDGRVMGFGKMRLPGDDFSKTTSTSNVIWNPSQIKLPQKSIDIANSPFTNIFYAKTESFSLYTWGHSKKSSYFARLILNTPSFSEALKDYPFTFIKSELTRNSVLPIVPCLPHPPVNLFGQQLLSDLTLKLSDGDFPVHRLILFSSSFYFRENVANDNSLSTDMTSYNPKSYKCLLKYFYQVPLDDLNCGDLFDLHVIALSYKEPGLIEHTLIKLRAMLNIKTVHELYMKAKAANIENILQDCELFMCTPAFKNKLFEVFSQDKEKALSLLCLNNGD